MGIKNFKNKQGGHVVMFVVVIFLGITLALVVGMTSPVVKYILAERGIRTSNKNYVLAESALEDVLRRLQMGYIISANETENIDDGSVSITSMDTPSGKSVTAVSSAGTYIRKVKAAFVLGEGVSFHYGVQVGGGGITMENGSKINGSIYSNGQISGVSNQVSGDIVSAGSSGLVKGVIAAGSVYANTIQTSNIIKNAHYKSISGTTVGGVSYPNSNDQSILPFPISDSLISEWENDALQGGVSTTTCPYQINNDITLGPIVFPCDVEFKGVGNNGITITLTGPVWVKGNITFTNSPIVKIDPGLSNKNITMIADNPGDKLTSSKIYLKQNADFRGSGATSSYVFLISGNTSAENNGTEYAISLSQGAGAAVAYANHGLIKLTNSINVTEITGYKINLAQSSSVTYDTGLPSVLFKTGSSTTGYNIMDWQEIL